MSTRLNRAVLKLAGDALDCLGTSIAYRRVYGEAHPRYRGTLDRMCEIAAEFFDDNRHAPRLVLAFDESKAEFQRVPLIDLSHHGTRLHKDLAAAGFGMVQIDRGCTRDQITVFVDRLASLARPTGAGVEKDVAALKEAKCRLLPAGEARALLQAARAQSADAEAHSDSTDGDDSPSASLPEVRLSEAALSSVIETYHTLLANVERGQTFDYAALRDTTETIVRSMGSQQDCFWFRLSQGYFDNFTFHHSVNVCLMTARVASLIVKDVELQTRIATAALLHDVGKTRVPQDILMKRGALTIGEADVMRRHPTDGAEILLGSPGIDPLCVSAAFGHHCHGKSGSYPQTAQPLGRDWVTELISVIDVYEALGAVRPYKSAFPPHKVFEIMLGMPGLRDRIPMIKLLYDVFGPYPVGATVELSTGERAVVIHQNPEHPYEPRVRVTTDRNRVPYPIPREVDLAVEGANGDNGSLTITQSVVAQAPGEDPLTIDARPVSADLLSAALGDEAGFYLREG